MNGFIVIPACYYLSFIFLMGFGAFSLGILSAVWPVQSINLYIWMMSKFNWCVNPIDTPREIKNTRKFGVYLILLGVLIFFFAWIGMKTI